MVKMIKSKEKILKICMLGGFTLEYDGKEIILGRNSTAKFVQLLQLVWIHGEKGIAKEQLMQLLYDRQNVTNLNNSLNNLLYRMRKQMVQAGLPEGDYITNQDGLYICDGNIPVEVDTIEFERYVAKAENASDRKEKCRCYQEAVLLYRGELLPAISSETWVTLESLTYKRKFSESVEWLGNYMEEQKDYEAMYRLYSQAAEIYPFDDWQIHQIESLLYKEDYKEAYRLYDKTTHMYSEEMGLPPSAQMLECYRRMGEKIKSCPNNLDEIRDELQETNEEDELMKGGAFYCSYPSFIDTYRLLSRIMERSGQSVFLMLCTLIDYEGKVIRNQEKLKKRSEALKEAIRLTLRRGDAYTMYSNSQYLILLSGTKQEDCAIVFNRINKKLKELSGTRAEISFNVTSLAELRA